jgi:acetyl esterase/lipase
MFLVFLRRWALTLLAIASLTGCAPIRAFNAVASGGPHTVIADLAYGPLPRQKLDVYTPTAAAPAAGWPLVVFFYGGSWAHGERDMYRFVGSALADRGVLTLVADYRLYPEVRYPAFLDDSALALAFGLAQARHLGADPARVFVMGHSAGGYNAAMLALDPRWLAATGHSPRELAGWIGLSGVYDFFPSDDPSLQAIFLAPHYPPGGQPIEHISAQAPPTFLGAPPDDQVVSFERSTQHLTTKLEAVGVPVTLKTYPHATHVTLIGSLGWPLRWAGPVLDDVVGFIQATPPANTRSVTRR